MKVKPLSLVRLRVTPWTAAYQAPPSMGFSRQKYWSGVPSCYTMACSPPALCPWDFPGKNTGVVYHFLLQAIFPTQRLTPGLLHCRQILYQLSLTCQEGSVGSGCVLSHYSRISSLRTMDCSPPGSSAHGILQARLLSWVAMPSSRGSSQSRDQTHIFHVSCTGR